MQASLEFAEVRILGKEGERKHVYESSRAADVPSPSASLRPNKGHAYADCRKYEKFRQGYFIVASSAFVGKGEDFKYRLPYEYDDWHTQRERPRSGKF